MKYSFERLIVWQEARSFVKEIYIMLNKFPKFEQYALCDQIRRASISIPSNIAEGNSRNSNKEKIHYIEIAYGSLMETYCQLILSNDLNYLSDNDLNTIKPKIDSISKLLSGLKTSLTK